MTEGQQRPYFSRHARNRLRFHRVTEEEALAVVAEPDHESTGVTDRGEPEITAWRLLGERWIRVTYTWQIRPRWGPAPRQLIITVATRRRRPNFEEETP